MTPLPGHPVLPDRWEQHHRPVAEGTMRAACEIRRPAAGPPPYPLPVGWEPYTTIWSGTCRLQELNRSAAVVAADQDASTRQYLIAVPHAGLPEINVGDGGDTAVIDGETYQLHQQMRGSELWEWDFIAQHVDT